VRVMCKPGSVGDLGGQPPRSTRPDARTPMPRTPMPRTPMPRVTPMPRGFLQVEDNFRVYKVQDGKRTMFKGEKVPVTRSGTRCE